MTPSSSHGNIHGSSAAGQPFFSESEWNRLQTEDRRAGAVIVTLITAIFTAGLMIYSTVCYLIM